MSAPEATGQEGREEERCLICGGTGEDFHGGYLVRCDECHGTGVIASPIACPNCSRSKAHHCQSCGNCECDGR